MIKDWNIADLETHVVERWSHWEKPAPIVLLKRLKNLVELYEQKISYPASFIVLGFNPLVIHSKEEHLGRICELSDLLFLDVKNKKVS